VSSELRQQQQDCLVDNRLGGQEACAPAQTWGIWTWHALSKFASSLPKSLVHVHTCPAFKLAFVTPGLSFCKVLAVVLYLAAIAFSVSPFLTMYEQPAAGSKCRALQRPEGHTFVVLVGKKVFYPECNIARSAPHCTLPCQCGSRNLHHPRTALQPPPAAAGHRKGSPLLAVKFALD
jgi:hypothetical protein